MDKIIAMTSFVLVASTLTACGSAFTAESDTKKLTGTGGDSSTTDGAGGSETGGSDKGGSDTGGSSSSNASSSSSNASSSSSSASSSSSNASSSSSNVSSSSSSGSVACSSVSVLANFGVFGANAGKPADIVTDGTDVYVGLDLYGQIVKVGVCGGAVTTIASGQQGPFRLALDNDSVYWTSSRNGVVGKCPKAGCATPSSPQILATGSVAQGGEFGIAVNATSVFWVTSGASGSVSQVPVGGGPTTTLVGTNGAGGLALDAKGLYWSGIEGISNGILSCSLSGCSNSVVNLDADPTAGQSTFFMTSDDVNVYWTESSGNVMQCAKTGCIAPTVLATNQPNPNGIATDGMFVYWAVFGNKTTPGAVMRAPVGGGGWVATVASDAGDGAWGVALDSANVYWTNGDTGNVSRVTKP